jgi:D-threo-aldose 1-dehydrogenase
LERAHSLWAWCRARGASLLAVNLQYSLREPRVTSTLVGCAAPGQIEEDVAACFEPLPGGIWEELHADFGL